MTQGPASSQDLTQEVNSTADLVATDFVTLAVFQNSGGNRDVGRSTSIGYLEVTYLGA